MSAPSQTCKHDVPSCRPCSESSNRHTCTAQTKIGAAAPIELAFANESGPRAMVDIGEGGRNCKSGRGSEVRSCGEWRDCGHLQPGDDDGSIRRKKDDVQRRSRSSWRRERVNENEFKLYAASTRACYSNTTSADSASTIATTGWGDEITVKSAWKRFFMCVT